MIVKMEDIAFALGVSKVTVSRALNDKEGVGEDLRQQIKAKAKQMGYQMNKVASALKTKHMHSVGILISERYFGEEDFFYVEIYKYIGIELTQRGYTSSFHILSLEDERNLIMPKMITGSNVDGVLVLGELDKQYIKSIDNFQLPKLFVDYYNSEFRHIDSVLTDNYFSFYNFTCDVIKEGYKEITYVGTIQATSSIMDRYMGYQKAMVEHNLLENIAQIDDREQTNEDGLIEINIPEKLPQVFMCNCDYTAYVLLNELNERNIKVPEDVQITGFDDTLYSRLTKPAITTKKVDLKEIARTSVKFITKKIGDSQKRYGRIIIDTKRKDRQSFVFKE